MLCHFSVLNHSGELWLLPPLPEKYPECSVTVQPLGHVHRYNFSFNISPCPISVGTGQRGTRRVMHTEPFSGSRCGRSPWRDTRPLGELWIINSHTNRVLSASTHFKWLVSVSLRLEVGIKNRIPFWNKNRNQINSEKKSQNCKI